MAFPLYDILKKQAATELKLTDEHKKKLIDTIKHLDQDGKDNLYRLIRYSAKMDRDEHVYEAKYQRKGAVFNFDLFPEELQRIVYLFVEKHTLETASTAAPVEIVFS